MNDVFDIGGRPDYDQEIQDIADYVLGYKVTADQALETARHCLMDAVGCGLLALRSPECTKLLGPIVEGTTVPNGARVLGTQFRLDPIKAAWDMGCMVSWLGINDAFLGTERLHPSDNLGGILACADFLSQQHMHDGFEPITMRQVLESMIMAYEIQGVLALENSFKRAGLCHVTLVRVATAAVATRMMGGDREEIMSAISHAWVDGGVLRSYRHSPNQISRSSWAAGDATSRAVHLADISMRGEEGVPAALSAPQWGFYDALYTHAGGSSDILEMDQRGFKLAAGYDCYVMDHVLFNLSYPADFHAQTAVEAAIELHSQVKYRLSEIDKIVITSHAAAIALLAREGGLVSAAERSQCLQYMVSVAMIFGDLRAEYYGDGFHAANPLIDEVREKILIVEDEAYTRDSEDAEKSSLANAILIFFTDESSTEPVAMEYPIGHRQRREEAVALLEEKFLNNLMTRFPAKRCLSIFEVCKDQEALEETPAHEFMEMLVI